MYKFLITLLLTLFCCSCASKFEQKLNFNPTEPLRVAVMPFAFLDSHGQIAPPDSELLIDKVGLISSEASDSPPDYVYKLALKELNKTNLDILPAAYVEGKLLHNGLGRTDLSFDLPKIFALSPLDICNNLLSCDAVLFGKITDWDRSYFAIQTNNQVGMELTLISARDGSVLFSSLAKDSESRGITKGPTGFSDLVLEPIKGLDSKIIAELARRTVVRAIEPLRVNNRAEFLEVAPPAIYASAHDGKQRALSKGSTLKVVLLGSPGMRASFSIGEAIQHLPMTEKDEGHYIGEFFPLSTDKFANQPIVVYLQDNIGRVSTQLIGTSKVTLQ